MANIGVRKLADELGVDQKTVHAMISRGLPVDQRGRRKSFDRDAVAKWIKRNCPRRDEQPDPVVLQTRSDVANYFNVHLRTVGQWLAMPGFPGRAGDPGKRNGHFPVDQIETWLILRDSSVAAQSVDDDHPRHVLAEIKAQREQLRLSREMGQFVDAELLKREIVRAHAVAKSALEPLVDMLLGVLPADTPPPVVDDVRARLVRIRQNAYEQIGKNILNE